MQARWESYLGTMETETQNIKDEAAKAPSVKAQAQQAKEEMQTSGARPHPIAGATSTDAPFDGTRG